MVTIEQTNFDILKFRPDPEAQGNETKEIKSSCSLAMNNSRAPWVRKFGHPCVSPQLQNEQTQPNSL